MNPHNPNGNKDVTQEPPYSRVFVVCNKDIQADDLRAPFEQHGEIEDIYMPKEHKTGGHKGIAYIKFRKTSAAASAIRDLHMERIGPSKKPMKVMLAASNKNDKTEHNDTEKFKRLFVKVSKDASEDDITKEFSKLAPVETVRLQKDRSTKESKGLAYVEFKTFHGAAVAYEECERKYKAVFATPKHDLKRARDGYDASYDDNYSNNSMGCQDGNAYDYNNANANITYGYGGYPAKFPDYNNLNNTYQLQQQYFQQMNHQNMNQMKTPMTPQNMNQMTPQNMNQMTPHNMNQMTPQNMNQMSMNVMNSQNMMNSMQGVKPAINQNGYTSVFATCAPIVLQKHLEALFNIIPGLQNCQYSVDINKNDCTAVLTYNDPKHATYAIERLHNFEFPSGEVISVTAHDPLSKAANDLQTIVNGFKQATDSGGPDLMKLADAIAEASMLIKAATTGKAADKDRQILTYCNVPLPPLQPLAHGNVAQRCFIICKPQPPPDHMLRDIFCRFGDLIDISFFPNKTFGFAKYASTRAAEDAIKTLNKAIVCGAYLKVLKADDKPGKDGSRAQNNDEDMEGKRMKMDVENLYL